MATMRPRRHQVLRDSCGSVALRSKHTHSAAGSVTLRGRGSAGASGSAAIAQDLITIQRKAGPSGSYVPVHTGPWRDGSWLDAGPFAAGVTYYYQAKRTGSDWSSAVSLSYAQGVTP